MDISKIFFVLVFTLFAIAIGSCSKDDDCYDEALYQEYRAYACPNNCPGVCGCDDKTYCNECIANSQGIKVVSDKPCQ